MLACLGGLDLGQDSNVIIICSGSLEIESSSNDDGDGNDGDDGNFDIYDDENEFKKPYIIIITTIFITLYNM